MGTPAYLGCRAIVEAVLIRKRKSLQKIYHIKFYRLVYHHALQLIVTALFNFMHIASQFPQHYRFVSLSIKSHHEF